MTTSNCARTVHLYYSRMFVIVCKLGQLFGARYFAALLVNHASANDLPLAGLF